MDAGSPKDTPLIARPSSDLKRKRSSSNDANSHPYAPPARAGKAQSHLQINYLARQYDQDLPLVSNGDTLPSILALLNEYQGVLERHESMAGNLGARPLGPILMKRFERLFDGPPKILKCHGKEGTTVTWLDVVEFARSKPEQFTLAQMSEGQKVCQFYTKQCRVQISEEDWVLIGSGMPQKLIPPQPIGEDEEKELGTLDVLERNLGHICQLADQVAARTRQLNHRLKGRKQAILDRRAAEGVISASAAGRASSPSNVALMNGSTITSSIGGSQARQSQSPTGGFVAVNQRHGSEHNTGELQSPGAIQRMGSDSGSSSTTRVVSPGTHEPRHNFFGLKPRQQPQSPYGNGDSKGSPLLGMARPGATSSSISMSGINSTTGLILNKPLAASSNTFRLPPFLHSADLDPYHPMLPSVSPLHTTTSTPTGLNAPVPIFSTPSMLPSTHSSSSSSNPSNSSIREDEGPYKQIMMHRVETLSKGDRVMPPCDRCRRLHMDCLKNLTACVGCTRKHAKCSWREVRPEEVGGSDSVGQAPLQRNFDQVQYHGRRLSGQQHELGNNGSAQEHQLLEELDRREEVSRRERQDIGPLLEPTRSQEGSGSTFVDERAGHFSPSRGIATDMGVRS